MNPISQALFPKSTLAILVNVFNQPHGIHLRALMQKTGLGSASTQRELAKLTSAGLLIKQELGRVMVYKPNANSMIYAELSAILKKTDGVAQTIKDVLLPFRDHISRAFIYGSVAKEKDTTESDIDLFLLVEVIGSADLYPKLVEAEVQLGRKISLTVYRPAEFRRKLAAKNHFLVSVLSGPTIELIGEFDDKERTR